MARILLVSGAVSGKKRYGKLEKVGSYLPPYGLLCIAAVLERAGHTVRLIDREIDPITDGGVLEVIETFSPDLVGLSIFTVGSEESLALAKAIKDRFDVPIVAGGPHVFVGREFLLDKPWLDYLVIGEGERTIVELVDRLAAGESPDDVAGLKIRRGDDWLDTPPRQPIADLDELPFPAFHLLGDKIRKYHPTPFGYRKLPHLPLVTSRGCPFNCVFCSAIWGHKWRAHSAGYVLELVKRVVKDFGVKEVWFTEDTFAINRNRVVEICEGLLASGLKLNWSCMTNVHVLDDELLRLMKRAGCWQIQLGLESGDDEVLKFIRKPITTELVKKQVELIHRHGIKVRGYFILGHLVDSKETIQKTIDFALSLPLYTAEFHLLHLPLGSEARRIAHEYGRVDYDLSLLTGYTHQGLSFVREGLTEAELFEFRRQAHNRFFLRPRQVWRFLTDVHSLTDLQRYFLVGQAFLQNLRAGM